MEKYGFVYIWYNKKSKMFYIGSHWGTENDGYICSSTWMRNTYNRHKENFKRRILVKTNIRKELLNIEHKWLSLIKEEELGKKYYNLKKHHFGHWTNDINSLLTVGQKISQKQIGRSLNDEWKSNISKALKGKVGNPHTLESKEKLSLAHKGKKQSLEVINKRKESRKGYTHSIDTCKKIGESNKGKIISDETRMKFSLLFKGRISNRKGVKLSEETKRKISESLKGRKMSKEWIAKREETKRLKRKLSNVIS